MLRRLAKSGSWIRTLSAGRSALAVSYSAGLCVLGVLALCQPLQAQTFPERPIRLIAPIAPGGLTDTLARDIAAGLSKQLTQPVVVENRPGGGGTIGMMAAAKAQPDGYTLVFVYGGVASVNPTLYADLPYNTLRDFAPLSLVGTYSQLLIARPGLPAKSTAEFLALARAKPGSLNYGSAGNATSSHMSMELFKRATGIDLIHVPYKGEAQVLTDLMGGQIDVAFNSMTSVLPFLGTGRLQVLGVSTQVPSALLPQVLPVATSGAVGFDVTGWYAVLAPAGTPQKLLDLLNQALQRVLADKQLREALAKQGVELNGSSPAEARKFIVDDTERWRKVIQETGIKAND